MAHLRQPEKRPEIVQKTSRMTLWYKPDDQFWVPKAQVRVKIKSCVRIVHYVGRSCFELPPGRLRMRHPAMLSTPGILPPPSCFFVYFDTRSIRLLVDLLDDALSELTYAATLAGLSYDVTHEKAGVYLSVSGYSDKLPLLLRAVVDKIVEFEIKEDRVAVYKEQVRPSNLKNAPFS